MNCRVGHRLARQPLHSRCALDRTILTPSYVRIAALMSLQGGWTSTIAALRALKARQLITDYPSVWDYGVSSGVDCADTAANRRHDANSHRHSLFIWSPTTDSKGFCSSRKIGAVIQCIKCYIIIIAALINLGSQAFAQDAGQANFMANCAPCHGADGRGAGPRSATLSTKPADLTLLATKNNGVFDPGEIFQIIDGRQPGSRAHLSIDMPIWGCRHQSLPLERGRMPRHQRYLPPPVTHEHDADTTIKSLADLSCGSEAEIQERILSVVSYLSRIQR